jgi:type VI secretion system secreted protein Hcp
MAFDAFLKIDGIDGESADKTHPNEIEILSYSWGVENTASAGSGGGGGTGKASFQDMSFTSSLSKAGPALMVACAGGRHLPSALLTLRKAGDKGLEFLKIKLSDCLVSSYQEGGSARDGDLPTDEFSLAFQKIDVMYTSPRTGEQVEAIVNVQNVQPPGT